MGRSGKTVRLRGSHEAQSSPAVLKSCRSLCHCRAARRCRRRFADRVEVCASRYPPDNCNEQTDAAPATRVELPRPQTSAQPAAGNIAPPRHADVLASVLNRSLHPQTQERAPQINRGARSCFYRLGKMAGGQGLLTTTTGPQLLTCRDAI